MPLLEDIAVKDQGAFLIQYNRLEKTRCEIYNFTSPTLRVIRFLTGEAEWRIDRTIHVFHPGDIVLLSNLNRRNIHRLLTPSITYEVFSYYLSCLTNERLWGVYYGRNHLVLGEGSPCAPRMYMLLNSLRDEIRHPVDEFQAFSIRSLVDLISLECHRSMPENNSPHINQAMTVIVKSLQTISENLTQRLTVAELAGRCGYTVAYFSRAFKRYIGVTPIQYIINLRLENAARLVDTEHVTILNAAYRSGFQSSSAFYKAFRTYRATTPSQFKQPERSSLETPVPSAMEAFPLDLKPEVPKA